MPENSMADLVLELTEPKIHEADGVRRAAARASLVYDPPAGSPERRIAGPRFDLVAPLGPIEKHEIDWYLESYYRWTSPVFQERARNVERCLPEWGRLLYDVLAKPEQAQEPFASWRRAPQDATRRFTVVVDESGDGDAGEAATLLLALPWELAHDGRAYLFQGGRPVRVRRRLPGRGFGFTTVTESPIRVLLVSPRPEDEETRYLDHRVSARPLLDAFDRLGSRAEPTLLQPPTLKALSKALAEAQRAGRPYHVVHFDGHGVYDRSHGLGSLCFEDPADEKKLFERRHRRVQADEISAILRDYGISLVFLEACQTAKAEDDPTSSVASRLLQDGVSSVVAMSHTVLVETARRFVGAFYGELVRGSRVGEGMLAGQRELKDDDFRGHVFKGELRLQDWFVPILFQAEEDPSLVEAALAESVIKDRAAELRHAVGEVPEEPDHGFVGRSRELLAAERLLGRERYVVLRGEGGEGKTTLAAELVRWLVRTRRFRRAASVSLEHAFDERAVVHVLGVQLVPGFAAEKDALKYLRGRLAATPTVLLFDNMETALESADLTEKVLDLARELMREGETRIVFTTREPLPEPFARHHLDISRLAREDAVSLVARVLGRDDAVPHPGDEGESEEEIVALVDAVRGHARSLVLLAREVATSGVRRTTEDLRRVLEELHERYGDDRERSLLASIELSLRRLPAGMRERIRRLAVFHGGGHVANIAVVLGIGSSPDEGLPLAQALVGVGLGELLPYGYLRLHPALGPALDRELSEEERSEAHRSWVEAMVALTSFLYQQMSKDSQVSATLTVLELPNLLAVLEHLRRHAPAEITVGVATSLEGLLQYLGRPKTLAWVVQVREEASTGLGEWSHAHYIAADAAVQRSLEAGRYPEAIEGARRLLERSQAAGEGAYQAASYDRAKAHWLYGRALLRGGAAEAALTPLAESRARFQKLADAGDEDAAEMAMKSFSETGDCLQALGRLEEAAKAYETSIGLAEKLEDRRAVAVGMAQLGTVRLLQGRFDEALARFGEARATFEALGESESVAIAWHQIGRVYEEAGQLGSAEEAYQRSLRIKIQRGNRPGEADSLAQLGSVYSSMGRQEEAVRFCRQAVEIYAEIEDLLKEGFLRSNIAAQLTQLGRHEEARQEILRALDCLETFGYAAQPWRAFTVLKNLEHAVGDDAAAARAREKAVQAFLAYRRAGGENLHGGHTHQLCALVGQAIATGSNEEAATQLAEFQGSEGLPEYLGPVIPVLLKVLAGSRDPALASDPALDYDDAAEILLLLETLTATDAPHEPP